MVLAIKKRFYYYKRFELDIWGLMKTTLDINPELYLEAKDSVLAQEAEFYAPLVSRGFFNSYAIRYRVAIPTRKISKICGIFWYFTEARRQRFEATFGRYIYRLDVLPSPKQRQRLERNVLSSSIVKLFYGIFNARQFKRLSQKAFKQIGLFSQNYLCLLEGRLCCVVYRAGFFANLFEALSFTRQGYVWVDGVYKSSMYFYITPIQMVGFNPVVKGTLLWFLLRRLNRGLSLGSTPKYMFISYTFLLFFWKRIPKGKELINPCGIDMLRLCTYQYYY